MKTIKQKDKQVLLTFVGSHDPWSGAEPASGDGPVLSLLAAEKFDEVHLFHNGGEFLRRASDTRTTINSRSPETGVHYEEIAAIDPTDYDMLYELMHDRCVEITSQYGPDASFTVATSSGTPQMHTCWMLLVLGKVFKARLVQIIPPHKQKTGLPVFREIKPSLDRFPTIKTPEQLRRKLSIAEHKVNVLVREREALGRESAEGLAGEAPAFRKALALAKQCAPYEVPVLIIGETGTGKEEFAKLIHFHSRHRAASFLPLNCASLSDAMAESELFGHEKGAFTGALNKKIGVFEEADDGTVFLDELAELPEGVQAKLLRVLNDGSFRPVGGNSEKRSKARMVAATNRDLEALVADGRFRSDLRYRLNTAIIRLPPLRERKEDISILANRFLELFCQENSKSLKFAPECFPLLESCEWPGNVRELKSTVERAAIMSSGKVIEPADLQLIIPVTEISTASPTVGEQPVNLPDVIRDWEKDVMNRTVERFHGNRAMAAKHLGYEPHTFRQKFAKYFGRKW